MIACKNLVFTWLVCPLILIGLPTIAQPDSTTFAKRGQGYFPSYWYNGVALVKSPLHWNSDSWIQAGSAAILTGLVISMDDAVSQPIFKWDTDVGRASGNSGKIIGHPAVQFGISGLAIATGAIAHKKKLVNFGLDNLQAQVFTLGATAIAKELTHRSRPKQGMGAYDWNGPFEGFKNKSFFSGHTSLAFSTATMIYMHSNRKWWVGVISYGIASGIGISRLQKQDHWASDVLVGAIMGTVISGFVYKQQEKRRNMVTNSVKPLP